MSNPPSNPNPPRRPTSGQSLDKTVVAESESLGATVVSPSEQATDAKKSTQVGALGATVVGGGDAPARPATNPPASSAPAKPAGISQLGKFKLVKKLGQGGMGVVFLGKHVELDRPVAIKTLSKELAAKADFVERFMREARTMARLEHPNAVKVFDVGQDHGIHFVAMEFIDGKSMQGWMDQLGKLSVPDAVHVVLRCAEALKEAHNMNLVHRDIKPDNIMLTSRGAVKVADFGLAKATDEDMSMTQSGTGLGTPYYMAPEQARNAKHVDGRADIYALGVTLYYLLTGKLPFGGNSALEVVMAKEKGTFTPARKLNAEIPEKLDLLIDKMIAKTPESRFKNCDEFIRMLAGMGLEGTSLSFITSDNKVVASSTAAVPQAKTVVGSSMVKTAIPGAATSKMAATHQGNPSAQWEVETKNPQGQLIRPKWTTAVLLSHIHQGTIDVTARARPAGTTGPYLPLAQYADFEKAIDARNLKLKTEASGAKNLKESYAKIERQHRWRKFWKKIYGLFSGTAGFIGLLIYLAIVAAAIGGAIYGFPFAKAYVLQLLGK